MTHSDSRYERLDEIERLLVRHPDGLTTTELARTLNVDPDTIRRDFLFLEDRGTAIYKEGRRHVLDHRRLHHAVKLTRDEALALYLAARLLSRHSDEHNPHVVRALEKLADALRTTSPFIAQHIDRAAAGVRSRTTRPAYVEALEALTRGWAEQRKVRLHYRNADGRVSERTFAPYFIEPSGIGYACYVIGWDDLKGKLRTLKIERITEAQLTEEGFDIPSDFDPQQLLANAWGVIWRDEGTTEVVLYFSSNGARRVKESVWHPSQRIEELPDGGCRFTVQVGGLLEIKPWIRQWGADVVVVEPEELRQELIAEVVRMARAYGLEKMDS
ncbi:MAG: WYL domain-containing protein [Herpetosiphonaceae bacterium]|nr:WYL domain-containing protein [Herpetosiphonaceae bacterium]